VIDSTVEIRLWGKFSFIYKKELNARRMKICTFFNRISCIITWSH